MMYPGIEKLNSIIKSFSEKGVFMEHYKELTKQIPIEIPENTLYRILFEMNKYFDKEFTSKVQESQRPIKKFLMQFREGH